MSSKMAESEARALNVRLYAWLVRCSIVYNNKLFNCASVNSVACLIISGRSCPTLGYTMYCTRIQLLRRTDAI